jgi:hypothetical protein
MQNGSKLDFVGFNFLMILKKSSKDVEVSETPGKRLLCCGFQHTGKAMGQVYQCWWGGMSRNNFLYIVGRFPSYECVIIFTVCCWLLQIFSDQPCLQCSCELLESDCH